MADIEKIYVQHLEGVVDVESSRDGGSFVALDPATERALVRKIDVRLIPYLSFLYLLSFLDRANIGNAKIEGLAVDLKMSDQQYLWTLTIFFFPYALFEVPSNILLKRLRPSLWIPGIILAWGTCMTLMGLVHNFQGLMIARFFLGLAEAGLFPGCMFYLSCWYRKREFGIRAAIFFSAATMSGAFGGLLAAGIAKLDGTAGKPGWAWIFILEGLFTVAAGVVSFFIVPDFPDTATFLTETERQQTIARLQSDAQLSAGTQEHFKFRTFWTAVTDWKAGFGMLIYMGVCGPLYAFSLFLPSIIKELGFTSTKAQLLSVPPYCLGCIVTLCVGFLADRSGRRGIFNVGCSALAIIGYIMNVIPASGPYVRYAGTFLAAAGVYPCIANTISWISNNVEGTYRRGIIMALSISWGNINGAVSSNIYRARDAPHYTLGHAVVLGYLCCCFFGSMAFMALLKKENERRDRGERDYLANVEDAEKVELGDRHPSFRYTL